LTDLDTSGLATLLLSFPGGSAGLANSSVLVGAHKSTRSQCLHGWNLVRGEDLKVRPTKSIVIVLEKHFRVGGCVWQNSHDRFLPQRRQTRVPLRRERGEGEREGTRQ